MTTREGLNKHSKEVLAFMGGAKIEYNNNNGRGWFEIRNPLWSVNSVYRVKEKEPLTKPTIPWSSVKDNWNYAARDLSGKLFLYEDEPSIYSNNTDWDGNIGSMCDVEALEGVDTGTCDWKDSLVRRHEW